MKCFGQCWWLWEPESCAKFDLVFGHALSRSGFFTNCFFNTFYRREFFFFTSDATRWQATGMKTFNSFMIMTSFFPCISCRWVRKKVPYNCVSGRSYREYLSSCFKNSHWKLPLNIFCGTSSFHVWPVQVLCSRNQVSNFVTVHIVIMLVWF